MPQADGGAIPVINNQNGASVRNNPSGGDTSRRTLNNNNMDNNNMRNNNNLNPLVNVRDRLFHAIFVKAALTYARVFPRRVRRVIEFIVLLKAVLAFFVLAYIHIVFSRAPINCLEHIRDDWPRDGILRVEILRNGGEDYSIEKSYAKEEKLRQEKVDNLINVLGILPTDGFINIEPSAVDEDRDAGKISNDEHHDNLPLYEKETVTKTVSGEAQDPNLSVSNTTTSPSYSTKLWNEVDTNSKQTSDEKIIQLINVLNNTGTEDVNKSNTEDVIQPLKEQNSETDKASRSDDGYIVEYSLEYGFLRLSPVARQRLNIPVKIVTLDPVTDKCFGDAFSRFILDEFLGYDDLLMSSIKTLAEHEDNNGFLRNVVTGEHYRFVSMWMARTSYLAAFFIMLVFTISISMLLRYSHHQVFVFIDYTLSRMYSTRLVNNRRVCGIVIISRDASEQCYNTAPTMELLWNWSAFWILVVTLIAICLTKVITVLHHQSTYWKKRGVPSTPNQPWRVFFQRITFLDLVKGLYNSRKDVRYIGMMDFNVPTALIRDPELIKELGIKHFDHFTDHRTFPDEKVEPIFGKNIFSLKGDRWKTMRTTLSPFFTSSKMKFMFGLVSKCSHEFFDYLYNHPELCSMVDAKQTFTIFANDVIATSAYGISVNTLKDRDNEFFRNGTKISRSLSSLNIIKFTLIRVFPRLSKMAGLTVFPAASIEFIQKIIRETVKKREELGIVRPDMIHLLMQARNAQTENQITLDDMVAQAFGFFIAGFDTVSTAMSFMTLEVANHPDIQDRLREEVDRYLAEDNGQISYEALSKMEYLDMVVAETLRKYPIVPFIDRVCVQQYELPPAAPGYKSTTIYPGQNIWFPACALHYDPQYFPDPEKFDPERFNEENKKNIVSCTYMPFGLGPRMCIANRFALMEIKIMMVYLMQKFVIEPNEKTKPILNSRMNFQMLPMDGFWYSLRKRDDSPLVK